MKNSLPNDIRRYFPFTAHSVELPDGHRMHYVDEGRENLTLFFHDIPLWSFYFRNLIRDLRANFRCVAPDYLGFGLSDKPEQYPYSLQTIAQNAIDFLIKLNVGKFNLVLHGWGGVPGMVVAQRWPERVNRIVLLNGNCFTDYAPPSEYSLYLTGGLGKVLIDIFNLPVLKAAFGTDVGSYSRKGYRFPYTSRKDRVPIRTFIENLPSSGNGNAERWLKEVSEGISILMHKHVLAIWGMRDKVFHADILNHWEDSFNEPTIHELSSAGRYALEEEFDVMLPIIRRFLLGGIEVKIPI
ncbi:MAG: alpha/beta fold hydrolase [Puniceicoccales bacterium]|jgi:haloalkane dehalogenase|nr:alpha/beta fold hydrolase [Puniceicoccales bacterium]